MASLSIFVHVSQKRSKMSSEMDAPADPWAEANLAAARLGCGICGGVVRQPPASDPFSKGPYQGRYWCSDCWTLYWHDHPEHLADSATKLYVAIEAAQIRATRSWTILFEDGQNKAYLTERGTLVITLAPVEGFGPGEYLPDQFQILVRILREVDRKGLPGFTLAEVREVESRGL